MNSFVVVSGLPASGKTTLARALAATLGLPHLDKDSFLESLFTDLGTPTLARRAELSRRADAMFEAAALQAGTAVLSSWWRHPGSASSSGTAVEWLQAPGTVLLEVHCRCASAEAVRRFLARQRHPGHADALRNPKDLARQFDEASLLGPLFPAQAVSLDTSEPISDRELEALAARIRPRIAAMREA